MYSKAFGMIIAIIESLDGDLNNVKALRNADSYLRAPATKAFEEGSKF